MEASYLLISQVRIHRRSSSFTGAALIAPIWPRNSVFSLSGIVRLTSTSADTEKAVKRRNTARLNNTRKT
jgi:hypothetical protein